MEVDEEQEFSLCGSDLSDAESSIICSLLYCRGDLVPHNINCSLQFYRGDLVPPALMLPYSIIYYRGDLMHVALNLPYI